jgi:acetyltransferase-like isoleucine patch superfamily enzyme
MASRLAAARVDWKRGLVRAYYRLHLRIAYFLDSTRAINRAFLSMPSELIPETLTRYGARIGSNTVIMPPLHVHNPGKTRLDHFSHLEIGDHCYIGPDSFIDLSSEIKIADEVTISMRVSLITHMHVGESPLKRTHFPPKSKPIEICKGAYIGASATVLMGVKLGECCVVGAGCVVTKEVPPWSILIGATSHVSRHL